MSCEKNKIKKKTLYLVATPVGNLADISERALKVLAGVDFIAAEDTRNSLRLLAHFGISKPLVSYFEHNKRERGEEIAARIEAGESCALVTDAGTPAISDPGEDLVVLCAQRGIEVTFVPGACAFVGALALSALPSGRFCFEGFLPMNKSNRAGRISELSAERRTIILYEAPHKLKKTLKELAAALGDDRRVSICRELTKINEEVMRTTLGAAAEYYSKNEPRGEFVLVVEGASESMSGPPEFTEEAARAALAACIEEGMTKTDAVKKVSKEFGAPRQEIYKMTLGIKNT